MASPDGHRAIETIEGRVVEAHAAGKERYEWPPHKQSRLRGNGGRKRVCAPAPIEPGAAAFNGEPRLDLRPSAFFSVSLAAASPTPAEREEAAQLASGFPAEAGWNPQKIVSVAGRLAYTQYGFLTRFIMKRIARRRGAPTDTSRDYEFTNWDDVCVPRRRYRPTGRRADAPGRVVAAAFG